MTPTLTAAVATPAWAPPPRTAPAADACSAFACADPVQTRGLCDYHYDKRAKAGAFRMAAASPARAHLVALRDLGWTWDQLSEATTFARATLRVIYDGHRPRILQGTEAGILAVPLTPAASSRARDSTGARRRVQGLAWMWWPCAEVAARADCPPATLRTMILPTRTISWSLDLRVTAVYDQLCMRRGPSRHAGAVAARLGFAPPLAWEGVDITDPAARPYLPTPKGA